MKLSIKGVAVAFSICWALFVGWAWVVGLVWGMTAPFDVMSQAYFGWFELTWGGMLGATLFALVDGAIGGALFAWLYNRFAS